MGDALIRGKQRLAGIWAPSGRGSPAATAAAATSSTCGTTSATRRCRCGAANRSSTRRSGDFRAVFDKDADRPAAARPAALRRRVTLPPAFNGQAFSLLRNGEVIGKGVAADGRRSCRPQFDTASPSPASFSGASRATARCRSDPGRGRAARQPDGAEDQLPGQPSAPTADATISGHAVARSSPARQIELTVHVAERPQRIGHAHGRRPTRAATGPTRSAPGPRTTVRAGRAAASGRSALATPGDATTRRRAPTECKFLEDNS